VSAGKLRTLVHCLRSVAEREAVTFVSRAELDALAELGVVDMVGTSALLDGAHLLLLSAYAPGEYMVDLEPYADYRVFEQCDIDAELAGVA
jgi:hypothetical protein